jgi:hypothetical protein
MEKENKELNSSSEVIEKNGLLYYPSGEIKDKKTGWFVRGVAQDVNKNGKAGRPTVVTPKVIELFEKAYRMGCPDTEVALFAGVARNTLLDFKKDNPDFLSKIEGWKNDPVLIARKTIIKNLKKPEHAKWYLERKAKKEFAQRTELTGADGEDLITSVSIEIKKPEEKENGSKTSIDNCNGEKL